jgi:hypothetical protein
MYKFKPGNIWSGNRELAVLTNPTELAYRKGNLKKHYPIEYPEVNGIKYPDVEHAYQEFKDGVEDKWDFMVDLIFIKLETYPEIFKALKESGGVEFLKKCSHHVYGKSWWEGDGEDSPFISALILCYKCLI